MMQKKIRHNNADFTYYDSGEGEVVVLLHGFAEDHRIWDPVLAAFEGYRCIIPDLPGSGASPLPAILTIESMADAVLEILKQEQIRHAVFIGHSMGGYITLSIAERYDESVKAFGLFHSSAFPDSVEKKETRKKSITFIKSNGAYEFLKQSMPGLFADAFKKMHPEVVEKLIEEYRGFNPESLVAYYEAMMKRPDRTSVLINTSKPILFIIGRFDNAIPFEDSMRLCHLPSLSYIHTLDQSGHMGMFEETATTVNILKNFVNDLTVATRING